MASNDDDENWFEREQLHFAASDGDHRRVKELLTEGYPINAFDVISWMPLHYAAQENHLAVVRYLISMGADVNAHDEKRIGNTVLHDVARSCSLELASILIDAGADPTIPGWMMLTALDESAKRHDLEGARVNRLLLEAAERCNPDWHRLREFSGT
jgi:ankyrin repeat protein